MPKRRMTQARRMQIARWQWAGKMARKTPRGAFSNKGGRRNLQWDAWAASTPGASPWQPKKGTPGHGLWVREAWYDKPAKRRKIRY